MERLRRPDSDALGLGNAEGEFIALSFYFYRISEGSNREHLDDGARDDTHGEKLAAECAILGADGLNYCFLTFL
jgi:hypothetical protein